MPSSLVIKLIAIAAIVAMLAVLVLDNRALRAEKKTSVEENRTLTQSLKDTAEARDANAASYLTLQTDSKAKIDALNVSLKDHSEKIQTLETAGAKTTIVYRTIKEKSDVATKTILSTHLPEYRCLFDGTCETSPASDPGPNKVHPAGASSGVPDPAAVATSWRRHAG